MVILHSDSKKAPFPYIMVRKIIGFVSYSEISSYNMLNSGEITNWFLIDTRHIGNGKDS